MKREGLDGAEWFYNMVIEPTVAEFLSGPDDIRRGILAAVVVSHMAEHYYEDRKPIAGFGSSQAFRRALRDENGAYRLITDVADASKHVLPGRHRGAVRLGFEDVEAHQIDLSNLRSG